MLVDKDGNITIITQEKLTVIELLARIQQSYNAYKSDNIIVHLTDINTIAIDHIIEFLQLSNQHREAKHSFVIVANNVDFNDMPDEIIVVPTLQEARDIIEMEEIERDLDF